MIPSIVGEYENFIQFSKLSKSINLRQLEKLKEHKDTKKLDPKDNEFGIGEVVNYVEEETGWAGIQNSDIYLTTNRAIRSLNKFVKAEIKKEVEKKEKFDKKFAIVLESQLNAFVNAKGFFSLYSKDVFLIKDIHLVGEEMKRLEEAFGEAKRKISGKKTSDKKEVSTKKDEGTWKKTYGYKPKRFGHREWLRIQMRGTLAHELFHLYMDARCQTKNMMMQEEYAYKNMIGWLRGEGLKDNEIVKSNLMWYGLTVAINKDNSLTVRGRRKELKKVAEEEAKKLMQSYDNEQKAKKKALENHEDDDCFLEL